MTAPPDLHELDEKIATTRREKESAIDAQDFEKAASLRDTEKQLCTRKGEREKQWRAGDLDVVAEVDDEQIAEVLGRMITFLRQRDLLRTIPGCRFGQRGSHH